MQLQRNTEVLVMSVCHWKTAFVVAVDSHCTVLVLNEGKR